MNLTNMTNSSVASNESDTDLQAASGGGLEAQIIFAVSLAIDIVGLLGNGFVIFVIFKTKSLRERLPNQFIMNQSIIDFCSCLSLIFSVIPQKAYLTGDLADDLYCKLFLSHAFSWSLVFSSTYSLIALTIERYLSIVHPVWHKMWCTKRRAWVVMLLTWVFGLVEGVAHAMPTSFVQEGVCYAFSAWPSNWARIVAGLITCTLHYIMPMAVLMFCYGKMILVISGRIKKVPPTANKTQVSPTENQDTDNHDPKTPEVVTQAVKAPKEDKNDKMWSKAKRNVIHALTLVSVLFALCWSMNQIYYLMMCLGYPLDYTSTFYNITVMAIYMNSCVNPFVYFSKYEQFKRAAAEILCGKEASNTNEASSMG